MVTLDADGRRKALAGTQLFKALDPAALDAVLARTITRKGARGEVLLRRGDPGTALMVILSGLVRISVVSQDGQEVTLTVRRAGEVLGEMSLIDGGECSADATVLEDCELLVIERAQFMQLLRSNTELCLHMLAVLSGKLRRANIALEDMASLDLTTRLGRLLARLSRDYGVPVKGGTRIEMKMSQKELGALVGASREKVNKQIRMWEESGVLGKDSGRLVILDSDALPSLD